MSYISVLSYLNDCLGLVTDAGDVIDKRMPLYLKSEFKFRKFEVLDKRLVLAEVFSNDGASIDRIKNRKSKISEFFNKDESLVFVFNDISDYQRKRLIEERISFIIPGKMIFVLELGTVYSERVHSKYARQTKLKHERMKPATQALFLYLLITQNFSSSMTDIAGEVSVSVMTVSRGFQELTLFELIKSFRHDESVQFSFNGSRCEVWKKGLAYMSNPVVKTVFIDPQSITDSQMSQLLLSGESALSRYTMLSAPSNDVYGIHKTLFNELFKDAKILPIKESDSLIVQIFKHKLFSKNGVLDELSTALVLIDEVDERVNGEIEQLLESCFRDEVLNGK